MSEVINLRTVRKQKSREAAKVRGNEAAVKNGRSKAQKSTEKAQADKLQRHLDAHKKT